MSVSRDEIIEEVSEKIGCRKTVVSKVIRYVLEYIAEALADGKSICFNGFGTFSTKERYSHRNWNVQNENFDVYVKTVPVFEASNILKETVKNEACLNDREV